MIAKDLLEAGNGWVGYLNAALGLGGLVGALAVAPLMVRRLSGAAMAGLTLWGLPLVAIGLSPARELALVAIVVIGVANTLVDVSLNTLLQRAAPEEVLARVFAMPSRAIERLAHQAAWVHAAPGETVVVQGDPGDRFFAVADGALDVSVDGRVVSRLGAGDSFGEIALLRQVPRTATVRAVGDAELLALDSDDFIPAMTEVAGAASREA